MFLVISLIVNMIVFIIIVIDGFFFFGDSLEGNCELFEYGVYVGCGCALGGKCEFCCLGFGFIGFIIWMFVLWLVVFREVWYVCGDGVVFEVEQWVVFFLLCDVYEFVLFGCCQCEVIGIKIGELFCCKWIDVFVIFVKVFIGSVFVECNFGVVN